jgi:hypothetical protein
MPYNLFWMLHHRSAVESARSAASRGEFKAQSAMDEVLRVEDRLNQLALVNMALWTLLKERTGLTEEELAQRVEEIDLSDGQLDGKVRGTVVQCPECGHNLSRKHNRCLYCGYEPETPDAFSRVVR